MCTGKNLTKEEVLNNEYGERGTKPSFSFCGMAEDGTAVPPQLVQMAIEKLNQVMQMLGFNATQMQIGPAYLIFGKEGQAERSKILTDAEAWQADAQSQRHDCGHNHDED